MPLSITEPRNVAYSTCSEVKESFFLPIKEGTEKGLLGCKCKCSPGWRRGERPGAKGEILQIGRGGEGGGR